MYSCTSQLFKTVLTTLSVWQVCITAHDIQKKKNPKYINNPFPEIAIKINYEWLSEENISVLPWKQLTHPNIKSVGTQWSS